MSTFKSVLTLIGATLAVGLIAAISLIPAAAIGGVTITRANETMESNLENIATGRMPGVTTVTDITGEPLAWIYEQRRYPVASDQIAQPMKDAIVAIEDRRFYEHDGVDLQGTARAAVANLLSGGVAQGASTINQQYVKNYLLLVTAEDDAERQSAIETSIPRKLREMRMASDMEKLMNKDEILTGYLNLVHFGNNSYGVEAAARTYFGIPAAELSVPQAAMLAGIVQSSSTLDPYTNAAGVLERRDTVLDTMADTGAITPEAAEGFKREPLGVVEEPARLPNGCITAGDRGFMCDYALRYLESKGITARELSLGGYTVRTTLDPAVQDAARAALVSHVDPQTPGVSQVVNVVQPGDNRRILAMSSSREYGLDGDAAQTLLPQPSSMVGNGAGSVFKIFTAAKALDQGIGLDTVLPVPPRYEASGLGEGGAANCPPGTYCVENAGTYPPQLSLRDALAQSPNTTFVKLIEQTGVGPVVDLAVALGLRSYAEPGSFDGQSSIQDFFKDNNLGSFTLGPTAINALELSNVGASIASGGRWCEPNPIESLIDREGNEVPVPRPECEDVLNGNTAGALMHGMAKDATDGTAKKAASSAGWRAPVAAKTGTTESNMSSAFLGFNNQMSAAPYIYNDGTTNSPLCSYPVHQCPGGNLYGGNEPAETWFQLANSVPQGSGTLLGFDAAYNAGTLATLLQDVAGLGEHQARERLEAAGYAVITRMVPGQGIPRNRVVRAVLADGTGVGNGTIALELSDGTAPPPPPPSPESTRPAPDIPLPRIDLDELEELSNRLRDELGL